MNAILVVLVALVPALVLTDVVSVQQCKSGGALPSGVDIEGCTKVPCQLVRGQDAVAHVDFTALSEVSKLRPVVLATALGITVPFELPADRQDACEWLEDSRCPLSEQEEARYELRLPVEKSYPPIGVDVQLQLVDQDGQVVSCFSVEAKVV
ncbi:NPC intracellular cholesterol transporter 2 homolog a-like [Culex pipiens pallens]|uniref:NPC intracellular cholesterol transporter 2 homolog a-like n=1 Tax=Culex pipiens pallens TaxID=42434 RepID=UPI00195366AF|nr:NPC intracellular cholesterol transporter 2 homolog a-like [Culex pipiens pallens]